MSFDYAAIAADAADVLAEFGASATLSRSEPGAYDATTGTNAVTTTSQTVTACVFAYGDRMVDGTQILASDRQAFISATSVDPAPRAGDVLTWGTETLTVVRVKDLSPARVSVLFECQVRNG